MNNDKEHKCIDPKELLRDTKSNIEKFGLQVIMVTSKSYTPYFAYSIGLWESFKHPEIICFGLPADTGHAIINDVAEIIKKGETIKPGKIYTEIFKDSRAIFLEVDNRNIGDYFGAALNYYNENRFSAYQLVWTDRNDKFPWEDNFEKDFEYTQPLLDRNADFKFREIKNVPAFTTRQFLDEKKPILHVVHDIDGDWQFLTGDQYPEDAKIVALEEIIKLDKSLNGLFDLDYGEQANRENIYAEWKRSVCENETE